MDTRGRQARHTKRTKATRRRARKATVLTPEQAAAKEKAAEKVQINGVDSWKRLIDRALHPENPEAPNAFYS